MKEYKKKKFNNVQEKIDFINFLLRQNNVISDLIYLKKEIRNIKLELLKEQNYQLLNNIKNIDKDIQNQIFNIKERVSLINGFVSFDNLHNNEFSFVSFLQNELHDYFSKLNYHFFTSLDVEYTNTIFDSLNIDVNHPSRTNKETFYFSNFSEVLRPHTTGTDIHILNKYTMGNFFTYGLVYRRDNDKTHLPAFYQFEILSISKENNIYKLKEIVSDAISFLFTKISNLFCKKIIPVIRFRTHYFPYTSPSFELDIQCFCKNKCSFCSNGWIEIMGCGLLKENICKKKAVAAGFGISRLSILLHNFFSSDKINNIQSDIY